MRKILSKILICIMMINTIFSMFLTNVFAKGDLALKWNSTLTLTDALEQISRQDNSDEVFLSWDISQQNGVSVDNGTYKLKYPIANNKEIELKIVKTNNNAKVTYSVNGDNNVSFATGNNKTLEVYKPEDKIYKPANDKNFPVTDENFRITEFLPNGDAKNVSFNISKGKGFSFKYMGNTIKFIWKDNLFYFVTNGIAQGNIYEFNLELDRDSDNTVDNSDKVNVFTGINKNTFTSKPIANGGKGESMANPIDQTNVRPITDIVGSDPELEISFEMPKEYNADQFQYVKLSDQNLSKKATKVVLDLGNLDSTKALQIIIDNIYANPVSISGLPSTVEAYNIERAQDGSRITFRLRNKAGTPEEEAKIAPGVIYNPVKITATRDSIISGDYMFEQIPTTLPIGTVYTYPEYSIVSLGSKEFYLKFSPFKGYNGYYTIKQGSATLEKWAEHEEKNKGAEDIMVAIPISLENGYSPEKYFQIEFKFAPSEDSPVEDKVLYSQILKYKAFASDIMLGTPENLQIIESDIIRNTVNGVIEDNLFVTFKWDIGYEDVLKGIYTNNKNTPVNIKYTFFEGEKPESEDEEELIAANVTVSFNGNGSYTLSGATKEDGTDYNGKFIEGEVKERIETIGGKDTKILEAYASFKIPVSEKTSADKLQLQYPNIYFISTKGTYEIYNGVNTQKFETGKSLPATLTLNGILSLEPATPQNINIVDKSVTNNEFKVSFDKLSYKGEKDVLNEYFKKMIEKNELNFNDKSIKYNVYITQDKTAFDEMIKYDLAGKDKHDKIPANIKDKIKTYDYKNAIIGANPIDAKTSAIDSTTNIIDALRKNNIVKIENMVQSDDDKQIITFTGLDENQIYYVIAETVIEPIDANGDIFAEKIDISKYSTIVTATTLKDSEIPEDSEKVPTAPTNFTYKDTTLNSTNLLWDRVEEVPEQGKNSVLEYEFIRIRGEALKDEFLKTKYSYDKTWEELKNIKDKGGFKTSGKDILEYEDNKFSPASEDDYVYESYTGAQGNILDKTLSPNQVYFYYIRTVRIVDGKDVAYSVWVPLSVTTKNVEGPKNLRVERGAEYNKKTEVVISFDIPKMNLDLIGTEYDIQYSIKKDTGAWEADKTMPVSDLTFKDNDDGKTIRVTYKIKGLAPGAMYTIRVRLVNKIMNSVSMYSNEVDHRTDGDNQNNDYDTSVDSWDQKFKELVEGLKKEPFWYTQNTISNTTVIYRPEYFDNILLETKTSIINLAEGIGGSRKEYYIPASAIIKAFDQNKGFKITYKGMDVIFSAKSIDPSQNEAIKMLESRRKLDGLADYYVKITVDFKEAKYNIEGNANISPVVDVYMEIVGTREEIAEWDSYMTSHVDELLKTSKYSTDFKEYIKKLLKDKKDNLFIGQQVNKYVEDFKADFAKRIERELKANIKRTFTAGKLNGNIIIAYPFESNITAKGYKLVLGKWVSVSISDYSGKKAIFTNELGSYTFTGAKLIINGIGNLANGAIITQIIAKYGLDDYLGKSGNINLKANLTNHMAIGSLARIAGNSKTQDPIEFFKTKGLTVSSRNSNSNISSQEAVYIVMKVYEIRTNNKIDTIKIRNYNLTSGIKGINAKYKKAIQVAFELGIYNNENMNPSGAMTVQEFLEMLANLSNKIGI